MAIECARQRGAGGPAVSGTEPAPSVHGQRRRPHSTVRQDGRHPAHAATPPAPAVVGVPDDLVGVGAATGRALDARNHQDRRQHRPDAGRPAEREGKPDDVGAEKSSRFGCELKPGFAEQKPDPEDTEEVQAENDDDDAGDDRERVEVGGDGFAQRRGRCAETKREEGRPAAGGRSPLLG